MPVTGPDGGLEDHAEHASASYPDARLDEAEAARWAGDWARVWGGRFGRR